MPAPSDKSAYTSLQDQAIAWLACLRDDSLSDAELEAFADWLSRDPLHAEAFTEAENLFRDMVLAGNQSRQAEAQQPASRQIAPVTFRAAKIKSAKPQSRRPWFTAGLAFAAMWLLAIGLIMPQQARLLSDYLSDYRTQTGEIREIQLSDGSRLLMNTNSAVSVAFSSEARRIVLHHGQVQFTVAKDSRRPFEVVADDLTVRALGTVFEVYKTAEDHTEVTVQEHAVAVSVAGREKDVTVAQGQGLRYNPELPLPHPRAVGAEQSAWQQHRLVINDRPLAELISELERYRFGRIFLADAALKNLRVTGVFSLDTPDEALSSVRIALGLQETRIGPWWVLLRR
ncbi:FecR family protein [Methylomonas sp. 11b]|uniref:FecR family protein n=1 Tax=Methylomonas sp. 11b TaxID=1168169 RepID=UPI00047EEF69|nr:FecR family protein [Methylomonas sp. 11b]